MSHCNAYALCGFIEIYRIELLWILVRSPAECRSLHSQNILRFDDLAHGASRSGFFIFGESKRTAGNLKQMRILFDKQRQDPTSVRVMFASITKNVVLLAMSMQIETKLDLPLLAVRNYLFLDFKQMGVEDARRFLPPAVEIDPAHIASEVTVYDTINVDHGVNLDDVVLEDVFGLGSVFE